MLYNFKILKKLSGRIRTSMNVWANCLATETVYKLSQNEINKSMQ
jgi:hypothetical protein